MPFKNRKKKSIQNNKLKEAAAGSVHPKNTTTRCGESWSDANTNCYPACSSDSQCSGTQKCWADLKACSTARAAQPTVAPCSGKGSLVYGEGCPSNWDYKAQDCSYGSSFAGVGTKVTAQDCNDSLPVFPSNPPDCGKQASTDHICMMAPPSKNAQGKDWSCGIVWGSQSRAWCENPNVKQCPDNTTTCGNGTTCSCGGTQDTHCQVGCYSCSCV